LSKEKKLKEIFFLDNGMFLEKLLKKGKKKKMLQLDVLKRRLILKLKC